MFKLRTKKFKYSCLSLIIVLFSIFTPLIVHGESIVGCEPLDCDFNDLLEVPVRIYNLMLGIAGIVFLFVIVWAGIKIMIHYFAESPEAELAAAKLTLSRGIVGIVIIALAYTIVNIILMLLHFDSDSMLGNILSKFGLGN